MTSNAFPWFQLPFQSHVCLRSHVARFGGEERREGWAVMLKPGSGAAAPTPLAALVRKLAFREKTFSGNLQNIINTT